MHTPTLIVLAAVLSALITTVTFAVWRFNQGIPGLRWWVLSFLLVTVAGVSVLVRGWLPPVVAVLITQASITVSAYLGFVGSRAYMGERAPPHALAAVAMAALLALAVYFTAVQPHLGLRFLLSGLGSGAFFLLTARTLAKGGVHTVPARYLFALAAAGHGVFVLLRPALFSVGTAVAVDRNGVDLASTVSQFVVLEALLSLVTLGFGTLLLANEYINRELRHLAEVDPLTSVFNRRALLALLDKALSRAQRLQEPLPVLIIDLDDFKKINDTWGHGVGDEVLRHFVHLAGRCLRSEDLIGRLGGEEFVIFLPHAQAGGALAVAERLRALTESNPLVLPDQRPIAFTVSVGVTLCRAGEPASAALQRADQAMYLAKQRGRNRVEFLAGADSAAGLHPAA